MFKRNPGRFTHKVTLLKPMALERDELGGVKSGSFAEVEMNYSYPVRSMITQLSYWKGGA